MSSFTNPAPFAGKLQRGQALVEFAVVLPVMLLMTLGMIDLGRAFVFGVAVQEGSREAARIAAAANLDSSVNDAGVLGRLVAASNPALVGCASSTSSQSCNGSTWTFSLSVVTTNGTFSSIDAARSAHAPLAGAQVQITAVGSVALLPGVSTGGYGLTLPQITVQGQSSMVIL